MAYGILVPHPGIEPAPPAVEAWSLNHQTAREVPGLIYFKTRNLCFLTPCPASGNHQYVLCTYEFFL